MRKRKTLAYGREKPDLKKNLFFSSIALIATLTSCAPNVNALPRRTLRHPAISESIQRPKCNPEVSQWLERGEKVRESICREEHTFVLTNTSLLIVNNKSGTPNLYRTDMDLVAAYSRTDMQDILRAGNVDWTASDDTAFFLTKDRRITLIPVGEIGETLESYEIDFNVQSAKLAYRNNHLLIAGKGEMLVATFSKGMQASAIQFGLEAANADFFESKGRLFFGNGQERIEIIIKGREVQLR